MGTDVVFPTVPASFPNVPDYLQNCVECVFLHSYVEKNQKDQHLGLYPAQPRFLRVLHPDEAVRTAELRQRQPVGPSELRVLRADFRGRDDLRYHRHLSFPSAM